MDILILKMPKIYLNFFEIRYSQVIKYLRRKQKFLHDKPDSSFEDHKRFKFKSI